MSTAHSDCEVWCGRRICEDKGCDGRFLDGAPATVPATDPDALAKLAEIPAVGSEERDLWLMAPEQHGFITPGSDGWLWMASPDSILTLMSEARKQGQRDVLGASFQSRVQPWMMACFGEMIAGDREERNHRFLEEALELVQACGCTADEAHQLVDYVYGRQTGVKGQEVGGVMVTLAALCLAQELDLHREAEIELARIWTKVEQIRAKQAAKPKYSPLPEHVAPAAIAPGGDR